MSVNNFQELIAHIGHDIQIYTYNDDDGNPVNVAIECEDCCEILVSFDKE